MIKYVGADGSVDAGYCWRCMKQRGVRGVKTAWFPACLAAALPAVLLWQPFSIRWGVHLEMTCQRGFVQSSIFGVTTGLCCGGGGLVEI